MVDRKSAPGRPIDLRTPDQRRRAANGVFGDTEWRAARVVARYYGERVVITDDNSINGMVDAEIRYRTGRTGVLEVTIDPAEAHASLLNELVGRTFDLGGGGRLARVWQLNVEPNCKLRRLSLRAPDLLARLEARGEHLESFTMIDQIEPRLAEVGGLRKLGVVGLCSGPASDLVQPTIRAYPLPSGGPPVDLWDSFFDRLQNLLVDPRLRDVVEKLGRRSEADEHHIFLGTTLATDWAINHWLLDTEHRLPDRRPELPPEIDRLWLWNFELPGRVIAWSPDSGWFDPAQDWAVV